MKFNQLDVTKRKQAKRAGRGIAAGRGKTAGRGTKGQKARTGGNIRPGFEGGQHPLIRRLPKLRGFKSHRMPAETVYTGQLESIKGKKIDNQTLVDAGLVSNLYANVKLIVKGELKSAKDVSLQAASEGAVEAIQAAGGSFKKTARLQRSKSEENSDK